MKGNYPSNIFSLSLSFHFWHMALYKMLWHHVSFCIYFFHWFCNEHTESNDGMQRIARSERLKQRGWIFYSKPVNGSAIAYEVKKNENKLHDERTKKKRGKDWEIPLLAIAFSSKIFIFAIKIEMYAENITIFLYVCVCAYVAFHLSSNIFIFSAFMLINILTQQLHQPNYQTPLLTLLLFSRDARNYISPLLLIFFLYYEFCLFGLWAIFTHFPELYHFYYDYYIRCQPFLLDFHREVVTKGGERERETHKFTDTHRHTHDNS